MTNNYADVQQQTLYKRFSSHHLLSNPVTVDHIYRWVTFFRRNLHRFAIDYLGLTLHMYQICWLYLMGISRFFVAVASRATAKSFMIAIFAVCRCILYPNTKLLLTSGTIGQARLIITEKIQNELMAKSEVLCREIKQIRVNQNETVVQFFNGSTIFVVVAGEGARGRRSQVAVREECRLIEKKTDDSVISPCQIATRSCGWTLRQPYDNMDELIENPVDIYITSSWIDDGHWMWEMVDRTVKNMLSQDDDGRTYLFAVDESVTLRHNIRSREQLLVEKRKLDPISWRTEYLNERVKESMKAFFPVSLMVQNQVAKKAFYPRRIEDIRKHKSNPHNPMRHDGEIRIVSCDMAFIEKKRNDNSIFSCIRALPETVKYKTGDGNIEVKSGYRRVVSYLEPRQGGEIAKQALRIRQLYEDFDADYIVLDVRNAGIAVYDILARPMYDEERDCEYGALCCMNDDDIASRIRIDGAQPVIYAINAGIRLNNDIAFCMYNTLESKQIDLLINSFDAQSEVLSHIQEYATSIDPEVQLFYEQPYQETQLLINEMQMLVYEKMEQTGLIRIVERGNNRKDRYTSVSYGNYFISLLEQDLLSKDDSDMTQFRACVTAIDF